MDFKNKNLYFIDLLRAICICNSKPMFTNQKIITRLLLNDEKFNSLGFYFYKGEFDQISVKNVKYDFFESLVGYRERSKE